MILEGSKLAGLLFDSIYLENSLGSLEVYVSGKLKEEVVQPLIPEPKPIEKKPEKSKKCPFCAELIKIDAIKCRFCGEFINVSGSSPKPEIKPEPIIKAEPKKIIVPEMILIKGGIFMMGSNGSDALHRSIMQELILTFDFFIGKYQVTQREYQVLMGNNLSYFMGDNLPVEQVSWVDAIQYCNKLSKKEGYPVE